MPDTSASSLSSSSLLIWSAMSLSFVILSSCLKNTQDFCHYAFFLVKRTDVFVVLCFEYEGRRTIISQHALLVPLFSPRRAIVKGWSKYFFEMVTPDVFHYGCFFQMNFFLEIKRTRFATSFHGRSWSQISVQSPSAEKSTYARKGKSAKSASQSQ